MVYHAVTHACIAHGDWGQARWVLQRMAANGVLLTAAAAARLAAHCVEQQQPQAAFNLIKASESMACAHARACVCLGCWERGGLGVRGWRAGRQGESVAAARTRPPACLAGWHGFTRGGR